MNVKQRRFSASAGTFQQMTQLKTAAQAAPAPLASPYRIGIVPYLNVQPLVFALQNMAVQQGLTPPVIEAAVPSQLARQLHSDRYHAAIVPVFEYFQNPEYLVVPGVAIGCRGPVASVLLFSECPLEEVTEVALDPDSLTSCNLLRVVLAEMRLTPRISIAARNEPLVSGPGKARLLIGDPALAARGTCPFQYDLGQMWYELTSLPFVFAAWLTKPGPHASAVSALLQRAAKVGTSQLDVIAHAKGPEFGMTPAAAQAYFRNNISYSLGADEIRGAKQFARLCYKHELLPKAVSLSFVPEFP